jgi:hypothetical protein
MRGNRHLGHGTTNSSAAGRTSGPAADRENKPNTSVQTAHQAWEIAQFLQESLYKFLYNAHSGQIEGRQNKEEKAISYGFF